ncbi:MAG TPA: protocatechuate 3,4-dioxygenase [Pirellulales bacterium]|jgi:protocatechuate 3,4-dioxygenase beta subunit|nr:protocatechuate 3,4-dioxygenase [Pirellulales bacterium]
MHRSSFLPTRRTFLGAFGAALFTTRGLLAEQLFETPWLTEGPFYPDRLPLDTDNDLIKLGDSLTPAVGEITHLAGRVLDAAGNPLRNATVEIWQCDAKGVYLHSADMHSAENGRNQRRRDANFQGYGRFETASNGEYRFRTIKPVPYPGRPAPHIHFKVSRGDRELITTQLFIRGNSGNLQDHIFFEAGDAIDRELVQADFKPVSTSRVGELAATFEIVIGHTPDEREFRSSLDRKG